MAFLFGCENVHLEYPTKTIFDSLSLGVNDGDCIGVVGRNGDGKSTLLGLFEGTVEPDEGRVVRTGGVRFASLRQDDTLADAQSVGWNIVGDVPEYEWASDATIRQIIDGLIGDIAWDTPVGTLSGGQRRRVDLARVLVADAEVLLLDEPTIISMLLLLPGLPIICGDVLRAKREQWWSSLMIVGFWMKFATVCGKCMMSW